MGKDLVQGLFKVTVFPKVTVSQGMQELGLHWGWYELTPDLSTNLRESQRETVCLCHSLPSGILAIMAFEHSLQHVLVSFLEEETEDLRTGNTS